jgi:hypothetical protein
VCVCVCVCVRACAFMCVSRQVRSASSAVLAGTRVIPTAILLAARPGTAFAEACAELQVSGILPSSPLSCVRVSVHVVPCNPVNKSNFTPEHVQKLFFRLSKNVQIDFFSNSCTWFMVGRAPALCHPGQNLEVVGCCLHGKTHVSSRTIKLLLTPMQTPRV